MQFQPASPTRAFLDHLSRTQLAALDDLRRTQADMLDLFGFGVHEAAFQTIASGPRWTLRHYPGAEAGEPILLVPAPIRRPYIWDLTPSLSAIGFCRDRQFDVHLIDWTPPSEGDGHDGIAAYVDGGIAACAARVAERTGSAPFLLGHSLGGTFAAICCALHPSLARGLVLLGAPLAFEPGSSRFRDLVVSQAKEELPDGVVPGALLSQACTLLSPGLFVWSRWMDAAFSLADPAAMNTHMRIARWALDEMSLPAQLVNQIVGWLYREDRFHRGVLSLGGRQIGPSDLRTPVLAVVSAADEIGPRASIAPFFAAMTANSTHIIEHPAEIGVGLQHLAILAGRRAHAEVWPEIAAWMNAHAATGS
ncbi:alpha/beta fold hydrolase [Chelatococcus asaccharovorans]|uniref:Polyhydroxyalkanoate synthase n=1 Tax=Chelatococcus asaccharovorans TaxID=28210 RepID=A0A2V3U523_9HYPH|nr:alpha/beta fold hydrolase [Chelatococcus asaccharovorans]MBS7703068.1 alpha/beta hydrolase [Chelatococcus asaccharovorans]PXW57368.1 polyhydroxyalkanoate synthase [Chelatococcus asaccharovorans]